MMISMMLQIQQTKNNPVRKKLKEIKQTTKQKSNRKNKLKLFRNVSNPTTRKSSKEHF